MSAQKRDLNRLLFVCKSQMLSQRNNITTRRDAREKIFTTGDGKPNARLDIYGTTKQINTTLSRGAQTSRAHTNATDSSNDDMSANLCVVVLEWSIRRVRAEREANNTQLSDTARCGGRELCEATMTKRSDDDDWWLYCCLVIEDKPQRDATPRVHR